MSRIEQALEKAAQLRQVAPALPERPLVPVTGDRTFPPPLPADGEALLVAADNRLLVTLNDPHSPIAEEYRKLKSTLVKLTHADHFRNTLLVTSAVASEGKSVTALNLAISLAQEHDHTVLLVDADLRRPMIHRYLGFEQQLGLADCLQGKCTLGETIIPTGIGRLSVIPAGQTVLNPVELFSSQRMKDLVAEIKHRYHDRYVIFDTPPVLPFAETNFLAHLVDGVLFVVKERQASPANLKEALETLKGAEVLGIVYNDVLIDLLDDRYAYYRGYYTKK